MPFLASDRLAENLRETNSRLGFWLESLLADETRMVGAARAATPQQISGLLSELMQAGEWLRQLPAEKDPVLERELSDYRRKVERLRDLLPLIHNTLLRERARLEQQRARVESATEWARRSRQTL